MTAPRKVLLLTEGQVTALVDEDAAREAVKQAYMALARGEAQLPRPLDLHFPDIDGEMHVKGGSIAGSRYFSFKAASGFGCNAASDLPTLGGLSLAFESATGFVSCVIFDNGFLTEMRTGAAGAIAAEALSRKTSDCVAILGAGSQARYQLRALLRVRQPQRVQVWSRTAARARDYAHEMSELLGVEVVACETPRAAVDGADIVVTTTTATQPLFDAEWIAPGTHLTAMGSDFPHKNELPPSLLGSADRVVADSRSQCAEAGEVHHALVAGVLAASDVDELGDVLIGRAAGRQRDSEITVADQTGLGVADVAMANLVVERALARGWGTIFDLDSGRTS